MNTDSLEKLKECLKDENKKRNLQKWFTALGIDNNLDYKKVKNTFNKYNFELEVIQVNYSNYQNSFNYDTNYKVVFNYDDIDDKVSIFTTEKTNIHNISSLLKLQDKFSLKYAIDTFNDEYNLNRDTDLINIILNEGKKVSRGSVYQVDMKNKNDIKYKNISIVDIINSVKVSNTKVFCVPNTSELILKHYNTYIFAIGLDDNMIELCLRCSNTSTKAIHQLTDFLGIDRKELKFTKYNIKGVSK